MNSPRFILLVLLLALACTAWLGFLALDRLVSPAAPPDLLLEEACAVIEACSQLDDDLRAREKLLAPGSPEHAALQLRRRENRSWMIEQLQGIHRKHGRTYAAPVKPPPSLP
jgi:hypothetical protein